MAKIILFDGVCNFCNWNVLFIIKHDPAAKFKFAALQSPAGQKLVKDFQIINEGDSLIFIDNEKYDVQSTAVLKICKNLSFFWKFFYIFIIIPRPLRDFVYKVIATNRYKWFGKKDSCLIPSPDMRKRFL